MRNRYFLLFRSLDIIAAIIFTLIIVIGVIQFDIFATIDGDIHLSWGYFWNQQLFNGQLYPKWFEEAFGGLGSTSFIFYPPLFRIVSFPLGLLHWSPSQQIKGSIILLLFLNTSGIVKLSRILFSKNYLYRLIAVSLGIFNPFLLSEIFKRGGFPSICSIALIPWIMIGVFLYWQNNKIANFILITIIFAAFFASHIPSSLVFISAYFYSIILLIILRKVDFLTSIVKLVLPVFCALFIDAF